ncbi:MAG: histidine phosphatase family protein [Saprospiraceae bacterium]|jgi:phosphohistidine phosphatase
MRSLFLIRHAKSSWDHPGLRDSERPLNKRGLSVAPQMAALLASRDVKPDLLISSPANRAFTTAGYFARAFGYPEDTIRQEAVVYEALPRDIIRLVSALPDEVTTVFLFGHNPTFTELANLYSDSFIPNVPTCGIVRIDSIARSWEAFYEGNSRVVARYFPKEVLV